MDNYGNKKPSHSYADLIRMAITSTESKRMTLSEIYDFVGMYPTQFTTPLTTALNTSPTTQPTTQLTTQPIKSFFQRKHFHTINQLEVVGKILFAII